VALVWLGPLQRPVVSCRFEQLSQQPRTAWKPPLARTAAPRCAPRSLRSLRCLRRRGGDERAAPFVPTRIGWLNSLNGWEW